MPLQIDKRALWNRFEIPGREFKVQHRIKIHQKKEKNRIRRHLCSNSPLADYCGMLQRSAHLSGDETHHCPTSKLHENRIWQAKFYKLGPTKADIIAPNGWSMLHSSGLFIYFSFSNWLFFHLLTRVQIWDSFDLAWWTDSVTAFFFLAGTHSLEFILLSHLLKSRHEDSV